MAGALHCHHAKSINTVPPSMLETAKKILTAWSKTNLYITPKQIEELLALLDPPNLVARRFRNPFRTQCTNARLRFLFYYHATNILGFTTYDEERFPNKLNKFLNKLWPGNHLAVTVQTPQRLNGLPDSHLPFKKRKVARRCNRLSRKRLGILPYSSSINGTEDHS